MDRYQYLIVMGLCLLVTLPLELVFGARVWRQPKRLAATLVVPVVIFTVWDVAAIEWQHWYYNPLYVTGWELPFRFPVEELVFFVVIPICGILTFEAVRRLRALGRIPTRDDLRKLRQR